MRSNAVLKAFAFIERLADGRPKSFEDFADITPHPKQRLRDLRALEHHAKVVMESYEGKKRWRLTVTLVNTYVERKTKDCAKCGATVRIDGFTRNRYTPDGRGNMCKQCRQDAHAQWSEKNRDRLRVKWRQWKKNQRKRNEVV